MKQKNKNEDFCLQCYQNVTRKLGASMLGSALTGTGVIRAGECTTRAAKKF